MRKLVLTITMVVLVLTITQSPIAIADTGGSCTNIRLGNDYIPRSPEAFTAPGSKLRISPVKLTGINASYSSGTEINLRWSRWEVLDQAKETLFYASYVLFYSADKGVSWKCSTVSSALIWLTLDGLEKDTDYKFALTATDGTFWAAPEYFEGSTNILKRPVLTQCIPEDFKPVLVSVSSRFILITTGVPFGFELPLKWVLSENNWKTSSTHKDPWGESYLRISDPVAIKISGKKNLVQIRVTPSADRIKKIYQSNAYSGVTSAGCPTQTYQVDVKKKTLRLVK